MTVGGKHPAGRPSAPRREPMPMPAMADHFLPRRPRPGAPPVTAAFRPPPLSPPRAEKSCRARADYRSLFSDRWSDFLHRNFRNPGEVARAFAVTDRCARNWWEGLNAPSGHAVALAFVRDPAAAARLVDGVR